MQEVKVYLHIVEQLDGETLRTNDQETQPEMSEADDTKAEVSMEGGDAEGGTKDELDLNDTNVVTSTEEEATEKETNEDTTETIDESKQETIDENKQETIDDNKEETIDDDKEETIEDNKEENGDGNVQTNETTENENDVTETIAPTPAVAPGTYEKCCYTCLQCFMSFFCCLGPCSIDITTSPASIGILSKHETRKLWNLQLFQKKNNYKQFFKMSPATV